MPNGKLTPGYRSKTDGESQNIAGVPEEFMVLFEHDPSEVIIYQALRHRIGIAVIFATGLLVAFLILVLLGFANSDSGILGSVGFDQLETKMYSAVIGSLLLVLVGIFTFLAIKVFLKSRLILTNQKVVLIQYHGLIAREVSQLNIGEVEDVNVYQTTIFDRIFKMGTITIETSGEQNNYNLTMVADPYTFAHKTIQMHEGSIAEYGN